jgi:hypothetical protein
VREEIPVEVAAIAPAEDLDGTGAFDLDSCEEHLGEFRKLLQADRHAAEEDLRHLQTHRGNESPATPQRAPLARELGQLNQLRQEIHLELDRLQRERPGVVPDVEDMPEPTTKKAAKKQPTPTAPTTKPRGTFLGLRRWLTGG